MLAVCNNRQDPLATHMAAASYRHARTVCCPRRHNEEGHDTPCASARTTAQEAHASKGSVGSTRLPSVSAIAVAPCLHKRNGRCEAQPNFPRCPSRVSQQQQAPSLRSRDEADGTRSTVLPHRSDPSIRLSAVCVLRLRLRRACNKAKSPKHTGCRTTLTRTDAAPRSTPSLAGMLTHHSARSSSMSEDEFRDFTRLAESKIMCNVLPTPLASHDASPH